MAGQKTKHLCAFAFLLICLLNLPMFAEDGKSGEVIELKAAGVPETTVVGPMGQVSIAVVKEFHRLNPDIKLIPATGLVIPGRGNEMTTLMQIAGDIAPVVIGVNFRGSDTYIGQKFLYPLDKYLEKELGLDIRNGSLMDNGQYVALLKKSPSFESLFKMRLPDQCWQVIRRECPYGKDCPYLKNWGESSVKKHFHVWCLPQTDTISGLFYKKDLFMEADLPDHVPDTMEDFLEYAREIHNPADNIFGVSIPLQNSAWSTLPFLYGCGGRAVEQDKDGTWRCVFNSPEAVEAYHYIMRLFLEPYTNKHGSFTTVVNLGEKSPALRYGMYFSNLDPKSFQTMDLATTAFGPVPTGPTGLRGSEFNAFMTGIYAGFENNPKLLDAGWKWMLFMNGSEAKKIQAKIFVESGIAKFVNPSVLKMSGYENFIKEVPKGWEEAIEEAKRTGLPEPYGRNCQLVYRYMGQAIEQMRHDPTVKRCMIENDKEGAKKRIKEILDIRVEMSNQKMLNILPEKIRKFRAFVAMCVAICIFVCFILLFIKVFKTFSKNIVRSEADMARGEWQFNRKMIPYMLLLPSLLTIAVWDYYPLLRGTTMAFQNYNVRGFGEWVGFDNFAAVIFSTEFWYAMFISLKYTVIYMSCGFIAPIVLAVLLSEVPRGKIFFRILYYLPAMLCGVVVIFLWRGFYGEFGMINQVINLGVYVLNTVFGMKIQEFHELWLNSPKFALFFCILPSIWAGMGPGCLIYLAALKGIPEDLYEAADIDGAGSFQKAWHISIPSIKALIVINFIGASIGCMHSGSNFILAMTGGGPYSPYGETEVIGLHIFWEAFGFLRFGMATAMAWVLAVILIGFTVHQLQKLSRMEFKAAGGVDKG